MTENTSPDLLELPNEDRVASLADVVGADLVPISVGVIPVVRVEGEPRIVLRHAARAMGIDPEAARRMISARSWGSAVESTVDLRDGRRMPMLTVSIGVWIMYLGSINENRITDLAARRQIVAFQRESMTALSAYWTRGIAVNPRGRTPEQVESIEAAAAGLRGPILDVLHRGHCAVQLAAGRRHTVTGLAPTGAERSAARQAALRHLEAAYAMVVDLGLEDRELLAGDTAEPAA